ncbi:MAG TPA: hypothetical protein VGS27_19270 [Candidatus Sulfotelmatobacter sp.]|nr:hypothetical protein [Candidatus Sulfotelmatobacter sp.]
MRSLPILLLLGTVALVGCSTHSGASQQTKLDQSGNSPVEVKFAPGGRVRIDLCPSGVEIIGTDDPVLRVSYHPGREDVRVRIDGSGDRADVKLTGCPHPFNARIEIPKLSALYVRMMAGQLDVRDITGDKDIEISFGQLNVDVGNTDQYARVDASVNSGEIKASAFSVQKGGLFRSFDQRGPGNYRLHAHVGAGQVDLR